MEIRFDTTKYESSHKELPKYRGRWRFRFTDANRSIVEFCSDFPVTYGKAKKYAREFVTGRFSGVENHQSIVVVVVLP